MGTGKKEATRRVREGKTTNSNIRVKGENFYRTASKSWEAEEEECGRWGTGQDNEQTKTSDMHEKGMKKA